MLVIRAVAQRSRGIPPCYENLPILGRRGSNQRARCPLAPQPRWLSYTAGLFAQIVEHKLPVCAPSVVTLPGIGSASDRISVGRGGLNTCIPIAIWPDWY